MTESGNPNNQSEKEVPALYDKGLNPESVPSVVIQILVFTVVVVGALAWYYSHVSELKRVAELFAKAREVQAGGDATAFLEARRYYTETGKVMEDDRLLTHMGEVTALLSAFMEWMSLRTKRMTTSTKCWHGTFGKPKDTQRKRISTWVAAAKTQMLTARPKVLLQQ